MENLKEKLKKELQINERYVFDSLEDTLEEFITKGIICAWDEVGLEFTHNDIKTALQNLAENYDVDKHISWAKKHMK